MDRYAAAFTSIDKDTANAHKVVTYVLRNKNTGESEWTKIFEKEYHSATDNWIRVGCRIYDGPKNDVRVIVELHQEVSHNIVPGEEFQVFLTLIQPA